MKRIIILSILSLCVMQGIFLHSAFSQQLPFHTYTVEDGLAGMTVNAILQDRQGYLWFGTDGGVSRFDGVEFITYTRENGLAGNLINSIILDNEGNLWFGGGGGVTKYDGKLFTAYTEDDGLLSNRITKIIQDRQKNFWMGTQGDGLWKFDGERFTVYTTDDGLPHNVIHALAEDSEGNIWLGGGPGGGICKFDGKRFTQLPLYGIVPGGPNVPDEPTVNSILQDKDGVLWIGHARGNDEKLALKSYEGKNINSYQDAVSKNRTGGTHTILQDSHGNLWFGTSHGGIFKYDGGAFINYMMENGLPDNWIGAIAEDNEGNLWFGTQSGGACRLIGQAFASYNTNNGVAHDRVQSIFKDSKGNLWFGKMGGGASRFDGRKFVTYNIKDGLSHFNVWAILEDSKGNLWFGTNFGGINKFDGKKFTTYSTLDGLADNRIFSILEDSKGNLWFGAFGGAISKYDGKTFTNYAAKDGVIGERIEKILEDRRGNLWFLSMQGTCKFDGTSFTPYENSWAFLEDTDGNMWFGSRDGLGRFNGREFKIITTADGHAFNESNMAVPLREDSDGNIWIGTDAGVSKFDGSTFVNYKTERTVFGGLFWSLLQTDKYTYMASSKGLIRFDPSAPSIKWYTAKDGLASSTILRSAAVEDDDGCIWVGTDRGVTRFDPRLEREVIQPPPVYLTRLRIFNQETELSADMELPHNRNYLRFDYTGICFTSPEDVLYKYKLDGFNDDWVETKERSVTFGFLPPGAYSFSVMARNNEGIWSEEPAAFAFTISPPFWATWWFRSILGFLIAGALLGFRQWDMQNARKREKELEGRVQRRTKALEEANERLRELDQLKSNFLSTVSHELRTPLTSIRAFSEILQDNPDEGTETKERFLRIINEESERLSRLIEDLLDLSRIESGKQKWIMTNLNMKDVAVKAAEAASSLVKGKSLAMTIDFSEAVPDIRGDFDKLEQVVTNLLSNAVKFTPRGGSISVLGRAANLDGREGVEITVSDSGEGIPEDQLEKIFEKFHQVGTGAAKRKGGTGLGLAICREIVRHHGGTIRAESVVGEGSTFYVFLPVEGGGQTEEGQTNRGQRDREQTEEKQTGKNITQVEEGESGVERGEKKGEEQATA